MSHTRGRTASDEHPSIVSDIGRIRLLVEDLARTSEPKSKDAWDKAAIIATFVGSVLLAAVALAFTMIYNNREAERQQAFREEQSRAAQTDVLVKLLPQLTSANPEVRRIAETVLTTVEEAEVAGGRSRRLGILDVFAKRALAKSTPPTERARATAVVAAIAESKDVPEAVRKQATDVVASVAAETTAPKAARDIATDALSRITRITQAQIVYAVEAEPLSRSVSEVIVHHTGSPSAADYRGVETIAGMGNYQLRERKWGRLGWHYAIAPDGEVWLGTPLDSSAANLVHRKNDTVSVLLILNGDKEIPSIAQRRSLGLLLKVLLARLRIDPRDNFALGHGFHRDYNTDTTCPGKQITKEKLLTWIIESTAP